MMSVEKCFRAVGFYTAENNNTVKADTSDTGHVFKMRKDLQGDPGIGGPGR